MILELKKYQQDGLDILREYLRRSSQLSDAETAFNKVTREHRTGIAPYCPIEDVSELKEIPYVCIRIPTGGGKTLMACHAAGIVAAELLHTDTPVVLWLTPSTTIREQTLRALRDRNHPYHQALAEEFESFTVLDGKEGLSIQRGAMRAGAVIIVSSVQAFRVEDPEQRKAYESHGSLKEHFQGIQAEIFQPLGNREDGSFPFSFVNLMRLHRPIVIADEAHNLRTELSFETLGKFGPSCILEFTATPSEGDKHGQGRSNVLYSASAYALKSEEMIKMPIMLTMVQEWTEAVHRALLKREELEEFCKQHEGRTQEYIRPIVLLQAQAQRTGAETVTPKVLQDWLIENENLRREECPIVTGQLDELGSKNILDRNSPVKCVITQQKLREGWDCPFAYIMCTVAPSGSPTAVEQILGRVMRLPYAKRKESEALNQAYAFATGRKFEELAMNLINGLVKSGFEKWEAASMVRTQPQGDIDYGLFAPEANAQRRFSEPLRIPVLCRVDNRGFLEPIEDTDMIDTDWTVDNFDRELTEAEYSLTRWKVDTGKIDIKETEAFFYKRISDVQQQLVRLDDREMSEAELVLWLVRRTRRDSISHDEHMRYIRWLIGDLKTRRGITERELIADRHSLRDAIDQRINYELSKLKQANLQKLLAFEPDGGIVTAAEVCHVFDPDWDYQSNDNYEGRANFNKDFYKRKADMNKEEEKCALYLDRLDELECWVRNPVKFGFGLPTSTDYFYPDFVCRLKDGRYLAVEYKSERDWSNEDSQEKRLVGEAWARFSDGKCLFVMPEGMKNELREIETVIKTGLTRTTYGGQEEIR